MNLWDPKLAKRRNVYQEASAWPLAYIRGLRTTDSESLHSS